MVAYAALHGAARVVVLHPEANVRRQRSIVFGYRTLNLHHIPESDIQPVFYSLCFVGFMQPKRIPMHRDVWSIEKF